MRYGFTRHARRKMRELHLGVDDVLTLVQDGDVIERYEERDGALLYGVADGAELHVALVVTAEAVTLVTTVYAVDHIVFRRQDPKETPMSAQGLREGADCPVCSLGGRLMLETTSEAELLDGHTVVVHGVPTYVFTRCGIELFDEATTRTLADF